MLLKAKLRDETVRASCRERSWVVLEAVVGIGASPRCRFHLYSVGSSADGSQSTGTYPTASEW